MLLGRGMGDDFERDNFDYVQQAIAATPPAAIVLAPPSWLATPFSPAAPPATTIWDSLKKMTAVRSPAPAAPVMRGAPPISVAPPGGPIGGAALSPAPTPALPGPMVSAAGGTTDAQAAAVRTTRWTTLAIAGAAGIGLVLLLRR